MAKAKVDLYCMECGESQKPKAKKCSYCDSHQIEKMEIEGEEQ